jgi:hypothetical protein
MATLKGLIEQRMKDNDATVSTVVLYSRSRREFWTVSNKDGEYYYTGDVRNDVFPTDEVLSREDTVIVQGIKEEIFRYSLEPGNILNVLIVL